MLIITHVNGIITHFGDGSHQGTSEHSEAISITLKTYYFCLDDIEMQTLLQETISSSSGISRGPTIEVTPVPHDNTVEPPASDATNGESPYAPHQAITNKNRYTKSASAHYQSDHMAIPQI